MTRILAIETSCDETGVAVLQKEEDTITVLAEAVASQVDVHALTGGVVPEAAAREHVQVIGPLIEKVLSEAGINSQYLTPNPSPKLIDVIAVTVGPGLMPALAVGVQAARTLAYAWRRPIVPVHHIEGHVYSALLEETRGKKQEARNGERSNLNSCLAQRSPWAKLGFLIPDSRSIFPALALIVSGGHTMLILMPDHLQYQVLGQTRDDAAGEAFDKVARLLNLPYPGGPHLSRLAVQGDPTAYNFPRPMIHSKDFDFSFSGLKTAVLYKLRAVKGGRTTFPPDKGDAGGLWANIAASFEQAVVDVLVAKTKAAVKEYRPRLLLLAGGVAANKPLRQQLQKMAAQSQTKLRIAPESLCADNAVMIGQVGTLAYEAGRVASWQNVDATPRLPLESFSTHC